MPSVPRDPNEKPEDDPYEAYTITLVVGVGIRKDKGIKPYKAADGSNVGFEWPDGTIMKPVLAMELDTHGDGSEYETIDSEADLESRGLLVVDYVDTQVEPFGR